MALLQVNTFSQALSRIITFHIILPNDAPPEMLLVIQIMTDR